MKVRKKGASEVLDAMRFTGELMNLFEIGRWSRELLALDFRGDPFTLADGGQLEVRGAETHTANVGDWIIGAGGDFYPCTPDVFDREYEIVVTSLSRTAEAIAVLIAMAGEDGIREDRIGPMLYLADVHAREYLGHPITDIEWTAEAVAGGEQS